MKNAKGTLETKFTQIIPYLIFISSSRITNGKSVDDAWLEPTKGNVYALHITPFIVIGFVIPSFINNLKNKSK